MQKLNLQPDMTNEEIVHLYCSKCHPQQLQKVKKYLLEYLRIYRRCNLSELPTQELILEVQNNLLGRNPEQIRHLVARYREYTIQHGTAPSSMVRREKKLGYPVYKEQWFKDKYGSAYKIKRHVN